MICLQLTLAALLKPLDAQDMLTELPGRSSSEQSLGEDLLTEDLLDGDVVDENSLDGVEYVEE